MYIYTFKMKNKTNRLLFIKELIKNNKIGSQEELLALLQQKKFELTQATLSRDLKQLKVAKVPDQDGRYSYRLPEETRLGKRAEALAVEVNSYTSNGFISIDFCGVFAVIKTKPGFSGGIAADIDQKVSNEILGTIAGDDTILIIPKEHISRSELLVVLSNVLPI
jgi:transcriptional regulator of arginine metabolism